MNRTNSLGLEISTKEAELQELKQRLFDAEFQSVTYGELEEISIKHNTQIQYKKSADIQCLDYSMTTMKDASFISYFSNHYAPNDEDIVFVKRETLKQYK